MIMQLTPSEEVALDAEHVRSLAAAAAVFDDVAVGDTTIRAAHQHKFKEACKARCVAGFLQCCWVPCVLHICLACCAAQGAGAATLFANKSRLASLCNISWHISAPQCSPVCFSGPFCLEILAAYGGDAHINRLRQSCAGQGSHRRHIGLIFIAWSAHGRQTAWIG